MESLQSKIADLLAMSWRQGFLTGLLSGLVCLVLVFLFIKENRR